MENGDRRHLTNGSSGLAGQARSQLNRMLCGDNMKTIKIIMVILLAFLMVSCGRHQAKEGQTQPLSSPTGNYIIEMPTYKSNRGLNYPVWTPTIKDKSGKTIYKDNSSELSGYHNSYWDWDKDDRLWIYNSDVGSVDIYYLKNGKWIKEKYDRQTNKLNPPGIVKFKLQI